MKFIQFVDFGRTPKDASDRTAFSLGTLQEVSPEEIIAYYRGDGCRLTGVYWKSPDVLYLECEKDR